MIKSIKIIVFYFIFRLIHFSDGFDLNYHEDNWNSFKSIQKRSIRKKILANEQDFSTIYENEFWPQSQLSNIGPVSGIATFDDTLFIFHRADRSFHFSSLSNDIERIKQKGPIKEDTILIIGATNGTFLKSWGANRFYLPNGISIDHQGNVWLTDVILNQVFKYKKDQWSAPELILGQKFENSSDLLHFCMPTDVAIASNGKVYISDGCNSRILILSSEGYVIGPLAASDNLRVPRSITLLEKENLLCIGDDGNRRIICYPIEDDSKNDVEDLVIVITDFRLGRIFAIDHIEDTLFALVQPTDSSQLPQVQVYNIRSKKFLYSWSSKKGFISPHDICVSKDSKYIFVCDLSLNAEKRIYKFSSESKDKGSKVFDNFKAKSNLIFEKSDKLKKKISQFKYNLSSNWPIADQNFGQIVAVDIDKYGNTVIFHRGSHVWNEKSFDFMNRYNLVREGTIKTCTVVTIDSKLLKIVNRWGDNFFYLPHGLSFDHKGNVWLTDVAMHQVFKYPASGSKVPLLSLGQKFEPGSDEHHFCKPTGVAVEPKSGDVYVADGYCNSRVMRFDFKGNFLNQWGQKDYPSDVPAPISFSIPHKIILINEKLLCVADREHGRILCFNPPHGNFLFMIKLALFGERIFSISYSSKCGEVIFAINGPSLNMNQKVQGFILNLNNHQIVDTFSPIQGKFEQPHDLVVTQDCKNIFVVEIGPNYVWNFERVNQINGQNNSATFFNTEISNTNALNSKIDSSKNIPIIPSVISVSKTSFVLLIVTLLILILILLAFIFNYKKNSRSRTYLPLDHFRGWIKSYKTPMNDAKLNLGRLLADPKMLGFDRVALDESDDESDSQSESEVEEFNVNSVKEYKI